MRDISKLKYSEMTPEEKKKVDAIMRKNLKLPQEKVTVAKPKKKKQTGKK